jgi:hypothetical protein
MYFHVGLVLLISVLSRVKWIGREINMLQSDENVRIP